VNRRVEELFVAGVDGYNRLPGAEPVSRVARNHGNFDQCVGCGLCNIGCRRLRKLSMLETYLPWAQELGAGIYAGIGAVRCELTGNGAGARRVTSLTVRDGHAQYRRIRIRKGVVVAAGAIGSSRFLFRSGVGGASVGAGLSCNFAVPPVVEFDHPVHAYDGLQMALHAIPESFDAIFETTFNPPGAHALSVPRHFARHARLMAAYTRSANFTALVGSDPAGVVSKDRDILFGRAVTWQPTANDLARVRKALVMIMRMARAAGGRRIFLPTHPVLEVPLDGGLDRFIERFTTVLHDHTFFNFVTAHPQGGNMMAAPTFEERVVERDFRVRGCDNLYACDASVFPRGIRVNPQWTIMALASLAGDDIARGHTA
jgi:choline dehydrogenase-like flavoprotein